MAPILMIPTHTFSKFIRYRVRASTKQFNVANQRELSKDIQRHAAQIEIARTYWACPFQSLS
jgi:hypothetical protein